MPYLICECSTGLTSVLNWPSLQKEEFPEKQLQQKGISHHFQRGAAVPMNSSQLHHTIEISDSVFVRE